VCLGWGFACFLPVGAGFGGVFGIYIYIILLTNWQQNNI